MSGSRIERGAAHARTQRLRERTVTVHPRASTCRKAAAKKCWALTQERQQRLEHVLQTPSRGVEAGPLGQALGSPQEHHHLQDLLEVRAVQLQRRRLLFRHGSTWKAGGQGGRSLGSCCLRGGGVGGAAAAGQGVQPG